MNNAKVEFVFNRSILEEPYTGEHKHMIYRVAYHNGLLATVGSNMASVYQFKEENRVELVRAFIDDDREEELYACDWSSGAKMLLVIGGGRGIVKVIDVVNNTIECLLSGHGGPINDIKVHPVDQNLVLTAAKDYSIRLWNIFTGVSIAIFCGQGGHTDQVLSVDFHTLGNCFASSSMDLAIKIWNLETPLMDQLIRKSYSDPEKSSGGQFIQLPEFSTNLIHKQFVDIVRWVGNALITSAVEDKIVLWTPHPSQYAGAPLILRELSVPNICTWFRGMGISIYLDIFAIGNTVGKIYVRRISDSIQDHQQTKNPITTGYTVISHPKCVSEIRDVKITADNKYLIASCDDSSIWIWNINVVETPPPATSSLLTK